MSQGRNDSYGDGYNSKNVGPPSARSRARVHHAYYTALYAKRAIMCLRWILWFHLLAFLFYIAIYFCLILDPVEWIRVVALELYWLHFFLPAVIWFSIMKYHHSGIEQNGSNITTSHIKIAGGLTSSFWLWTAIIVLFIDVASLGYEIKYYILHPVYQGIMLLALWSYLTLLSIICVIVFGYLYFYSGQLQKVWRHYYLDRYKQQQQE